MPGSARIAIIGAGLAGLTLAHRLAGSAEITLFEKSRGVGGRMSTRRAGDFTFDHGAQYFTAKEEAFTAFLAPFLAAGIVTEWAPRLAILGAPDSIAPLQEHPRYVAQPAMNSLCKALAAGMDVRSGVEVAELMRADDLWHVRSKDGTDLGRFDWVLSTVPAVQTDRLMPEGFCGKNQLSQSRMSGCYSLMLGFHDVQSPAWDAARVLSLPLAWIAVNSRKPGREGGVSILCQTHNAWADANLERDQIEVRDELLAAFRALTDMTAPADHVSLHRWRYASVERACGMSCLIDPALRLGAAGDWCGAGRVEAAFDSAVALATSVMQNIHVGDR